jgi:hypothetical protein
MRVLFLLVLAGCGGTDSVPTAMQQFLGTWAFSSGASYNVVCPNGTKPVSLTGSITVKSDPAGLLVLDAAGCNFTYAVADHTASLGDKKTCSFPAEQGVTADVTYDAITLTTSDGHQMSDVFSGKVRYTASTGTLDCAFSGAATLTR